MNIELPFCDAARGDGAAPDGRESELLDQKYELLECLGQGGFGAVLLARHVYLDRQVAIKVLHPNITADETHVSRFFREAKLTSRLRHPNVVTAHDFGIADGAPYLVMEYVSGQTLRQLLNERRSISAAELLPIALDVARALVAAHELGIVHRDLKPENVLLTGSTEGVVAKVLDFGIAKLCGGDAQEAQDSLHTDPGVFQGTPRYASPEQIRSQAVDGRADIYSFGVMLYEALVGGPPFECDSAIQLAMKHLSSEVVPLRERRPDLDCPAELEALIHRCIAKDPSHRFTDARSLVHVFEELLKPAVPEPVAHSRRLPALGVVGAAAMLLCGALLQRPAPPAEGSPVTRPQVTSAAAPEESRLMAKDEQFDALFAQAKSSYYAEQYSDAAAIFRAVLAERPGDVTAQLLLALSYKKLGRAEEAIQLLEGLDPSLQATDRVSYQLAVLNAQIGKMEEALTRLQQAVKVNGAIKDRVKTNPVFEPLEHDGRFRKRYHELLDEPVHTAARQSAPVHHSFSLERSFGRMLEGLNGMM